MVDEYEEEVQARWGDTDAYRQSTAKTSKYSRQDFAAAKVDQEAATELFVYAFGNSLPIDSDKTKAAVLAHRQASKDALTVGRKLVVEIINTLNLLRRVR